MITLLIVMSPFALIGLYFVGWFLKEEWEMEHPKKNTEPYDPHSPMVQRFQYLAGIRGNLYTTYSRSYLRDRFNQVRYSL